MEYLLGLDIGTSSVKGILMDISGKQVAAEKADFIYKTDENGAVEIDAADYLEVCFSAIRRLVEFLPDGGEIKALCAASASGNLLVLDKNNKPATPIFNWRDTRVLNEAKEILGDFNIDDYYRKTGWKFDFKTFPLALLCYLKKHRPEILKSCSKVCMSTEYMYYILTSKWGIGTSAGTPFYLIEQEKGKYVQEVLDILGITENELPPVMKTGSVLGYVTAGVAEMTNLPEGTPVVLGTFDHPSAARGTGILEEGQLLLSCGTSWVAFFPINDRNEAVKHSLLIDPFLSPAGPYGAMFSLASISDRIKLYIKKFISDEEDYFNVFSDYSDKSSLGAGGLKINIYDDPDDSLAEYRKEDVARAIMESVARLLTEKIAEFKIDIKSAVMVGGPSEDKVWLRVMSEVTGLDVKGGQGAYAGALGAAIVGGIGVGIYENEKMRRF